MSTKSKKFLGLMSQQLLIEVLAHSSTAVTATIPVASSSISAVKVIVENKH